MLRITTTKTSAIEPLLVLEGRLIGPWVDELRAAVDAVGEPFTRLHLDLAQVRFVDAAGLALLIELQERQAVLAPVSRIVQALLLFKRSA